jgi:hypothetical protein
MGWGLLDQSGGRLPACYATRRDSGNQIIGGKMGFPERNGRAARDRVVRGDPERREESHG